MLEFLKRMELSEDDEGNMVVIHGYDPEGNPALKSKFDYPYSYDPFIIHQFGEKKECTGTIYSDRLLQWDYDKHNELCEKHFGNIGQSWDERDPKKIEAFLRDWTENPKLKLLFVTEYCNLSNGFPCWRFDYNHGEKR